MEKNNFLETCDSTNYKIYTGLKKSTSKLISTSGSMLQYSLINNLIDILTYITSVTYLRMEWSNEKEYKEDVKQIRELYNYFLNSYNKLNKIFDLSNPVEIYTMFTYLLNKGYLSKNRKFEFLDRQEIDLKVLLGTEVITGKAVCRHISSMLTDILNKCGIESCQLGIYSKIYVLNIDNIEEQKYTKEELAQWVRTHIPNKQDYEYLMKRIDELVDNEKQNIEFTLEIVDDEDILQKKIANHAISFAFKDGKSYFLDSTQTRIYRMKESNEGILYDNFYDDIPIRLKSSIELNALKDYLKMKKYLSNPCLSITPEEEQLLVKSTLDKCKNNTDIFEQFYDDNCELYDDISSKVLRIRKYKTFF